MIFVVAKLRILDNFGFEQVRGQDCKGISRALVEVWYAGGEPGLAKCWTACEN